MQRRDDVASVHPCDGIERSVKSTTSLMQGWRRSHILQQGLVCQTR